MTNANLDENHFSQIESLLIWGKLRYLSMRDNKRLTHIGDEICQIQPLQEMKLSNCRITTVTATIGTLKHLQELKLDRNQLK